MRKIVTLALLICTATVGSAAADRYRGHDRGHDRGSRVVVRDNRSHDYRRDNRSYDNRRDFRRDNFRRDYRHVDYRYVDRRPVHYSNGYYNFNGGYRVAYHRPIITQRYYDYRIRPTLLVESCDTVPGYVWVSGNWNWNGYEWVWIGGHYVVDTNYVYDGY